MSARFETMAEIERRYPNEWVLIDRPTDDPRTGRVAGGFVVMHTPDRDELDRRLVDENEFPEVTLGAVLYIGRPPEDADLDLPPLARAQ